jgi:HEPN domain-containing protein
MKRQTARWIRKAEEDLAAAKELAGRQPPLRSTACFHCQQATEKNLKAYLQELNVPVPKTHDLETLLNLLLPYDTTLGKLRRSLVSLTKFAVEYRYPGAGATTKQMQSALRIAERVRLALRNRLGLP